MKFSCVCLHGDRNPKERNSNLQMFKDKQAKFLICTDVAARGLDIKGVPFVINVTLPDEKANYVHRIGRVGRADRYYNNLLTFFFFKKVLNTYLGH